MKQIEQIIKARDAKQEFVVATVVDTQGSTPGQLGFRMLVFADRTEGTVGGGALEMTVGEAAREILLKRQSAQLRSFNLAELNMSCGGQASIFFEPCFRKPPLWIFGAGHVARALAPMVAAVGFHLTVVDNRPGFATAEYFPSGAELLTEDYPLASSRMPVNAYAVIVTHGHAHDEEILNALSAVKPPLPYIGMIGSKRKVGQILKKMEQSGLEDLNNIYTPIGLKLGGDSAEEIALAIAAEILGVYHRVQNLPHCRLDLGR